VTRRARLFVLVPVVTIFMMWLALAIYLDGDYASRLPASPDSNSGRVTAISVHHGVRVFATASEIKIYNWITKSLFYVGAVTAVVGIWHNTQLRRDRKARPR
jgi:hypothetical protein